MVKHLTPCRAPHHNTPLNPLSRGEYHHTTNHSLPKRNKHPNLPSREGLGVCDARAQLPNSKRSMKLNRKYLLQLYRESLIPTRTPHRNTPLYPLSRGEYHHTTNHSLPKRNKHPNLPSREGPGVCDVCAQLPKSKTTTRNQEIPPLQTAAKYLCPCRASHHNTPL